MIYVYFYESIFDDKSNHIIFLFSNSIIWEVFMIYIFMVWLKSCPKRLFLRVRREYESCKQQKIHNEPPLHWHIQQHEAQMQSPTTNSTEAQTETEQQISPTFFRESSFFFWDNEKKSSRLWSQEEATANTRFAARTYAITHPRLNKKFPTSLTVCWRHLLKANLYLY